MYYFSVPSDFSKKTIDEFYILNHSSTTCCVKEVYGQATDIDFTMSGRMPSMLPYVRLSELIDYASYCQQKGIHFNYCFNASCIGNDEFDYKKAQLIKEFVYRLYQEGIRIFTVAMPSLMELIDSLNLDVEIKASAICEINSVERAMFYKKRNINRMVIDPDLNRNFNVIENIVHAYGNGAEIIVNNMCVKNCSYKKFHYNHESHSIKNNQVIHDYYINRCYIQKAEDPLAYIHINWIRPEDIHYYYEVGISHFKLQGRTNVRGEKLIRCLKHYFNQNYSGDLMQLLMIFAPYNSFHPYVDNKKLDGFVKNFIDNPTLCTGLCDKCQYCRAYADRAIDMNALQTLNERSKVFYNSTDRFMSLKSEQ